MGWISITRTGVGTGIAVLAFSEEGEQAQSRIDRKHTPVTKAFVFIFLTFYLIWRREKLCMRRHYNRLIFLII
jgi:hypothetical protein